MRGYSDLGILRRDSLPEAPRAATARVAVQGAGET
jgi:hypothetical protein